jgi:hypothetical protein
MEPWGTPFFTPKSRVGAGAGAASKIYPEPETHKNDAAPLHCLNKPSSNQEIYLSKQ